MTWDNEKAQQVIEITGLPEGFKRISTWWVLSDDASDIFSGTQLTDEQATDFINAHAERWLEEWCKAGKTNRHGISTTRQPNEERVSVAIWDDYGTTRKTFTAPTKSEALIDAILAVNDG